MKSAGIPSNQPSAHILIGEYMRVIFLNPQGNFDESDSYWCEHPDFGGQLVYVKEVCIAMARMGVKVDIITRLVNDNEWPPFSKEIDYYKGQMENLRIVRIPCGGPKFLNKELLWEHLNEFTDNILDFYKGMLPDFATAHYGDGGYSAVLLKKKAGINFTFTGHSLGAQKLDKLGMSVNNFDKMEERYHFSKRIIAERLAMKYAYNIITSTSQERMEQYSHPLYKDTNDVNDDSKFSIIPPGVNTYIFTTEDKSGDNKVYDMVKTKIQGSKKPYIIVSSRLDEKKNIIGVIKAYALSKELQNSANLGIFVRGVDDPCGGIKELPENEQQILQPILDIIANMNLNDKVTYFNIKSQKELAATYKYFARQGSVFALTSFYEPFGLAPIEAAACGLAVVATKNGGPSEIFEDGSGILVNPFDEDDIASGLLKGMTEYSHYAGLGERRVKEKYTWESTAKAYLSVIQKGLKQPDENEPDIPELNATEIIITYLSRT
jgi:sucrose-phosphate synthase